MHYFHINYLKKKKKAKYVLKAKNENSAINKFRNNIEKNSSSKTKILKCKRSNKIKSNTSTYCIRDAKWIVYQNLCKKTKKRLTIQDIKTILNFFYDYLEEKGFIKTKNDTRYTKTISHIRDENIPSNYEGEDLLLSAGDICSYVQIEALIKRKKLYLFDDIYNVFVAETKYLEETGLSDMYG